MSVIIKAEELGKKYILSHQRKQSYYALRDVMTDSVKRWGRKVLHPLSSRRDPDPTHEEFWALKDVSFEIKQGDRVGIIGRNGAGKSTLLKILSRITEPTKGRVTIRGRVASLLEVGTGFHPELTGRENVYLNGAILGMTKAEIKSKFDEIVAFAEVEKFLDTPVKRYSSGMYVRLAFAVAAHLEPEILLVDEVLAVGDAQFQKKCLGKMKHVSTEEGRTVVFVSHNISALQTLCTKAIQLNKGKVVGYGAVNEQIKTYLNAMQRDDEIRPSGPVRIGPHLLLHKFTFTPNPVASGDEQAFQIELAGDQPDRIDSLAILFYSSLGERIAILDLRHSGFPLYIEGEPLVIRGKISSLPFVEGEYNVGLYMESRDVRENFLDLTKITITDNASDNGMVSYPASVRGVVELNFNLILS